MSSCFLFITTVRNGVWTDCCIFIEDRDCSVSVLWREGVFAARLNAECEKKKSTETRRCWGLYTAGNGYFWLLLWGTNYTQVTTKIGVTLSNFYPIVCVHTSWVSWCFCTCVFLTVKVSYTGRGVSEHYFCIIHPEINCKRISVCRVCLCVESLCWPAWLRVSQRLWMSVSRWSHLLQRSCKLLTIPGRLLSLGVK